MNTSLRLLPLWSGGNSTLWRCLTTSSVFAAKMRKPVVISKIKPKAGKVQIWNGITIQQLAEVTQRSLDDIFEASLYIEARREYERETDRIDNDDIHKILKLLGFRGVISNVPIAHIKRQFEKDFEQLDLIRQPPAKPEQLRPRRPVVAVMGHVDHGKTTLLDTLRNSHIVDTEFGGITQHIGAFSVRVPNYVHEAITFLDTPGHAAFSAMRARGANVTDMVVLVVAADDGVMEQTIESIRFASNAEVPIVVAVNKMDKPQADFDRVKNGLIGYGLQSDTEGGDVQFVPVSALKGDGIDKLLEAIILQGEILDLKAAFEGRCEGYIIESSTEKHRGKLATVLIDRGTLRKGSFIVAGTSWCKIRTMFDEMGKAVDEVPPGCAAQVTGWKALPKPGDLVLEVETERRAKDVVDLRLTKEKTGKLVEDDTAIEERTSEERVKYREALEAKWNSGYRRRRILMSPKMATSDKDDKPILRIIVKGDTDGSVEALLDVLDTYDKHDECKLDIVHFGVGPVTKNDLEKAKAFEGIVYAMHVSLAPEAKESDLVEKVSIKEFKVIYHLVNDLKREISGRLPLADAEEELGEAAVLQEFMVSDERTKKKVPVAGCRCIKGELKRTEMFRLIRDDKEIYRGPIISMKHLKDEVDSIRKDVECGIKLQDISIRLKPGDVISCFRLYKEPQTTSWVPPGF